jgi:alpha-ribazole phosphatase
MEIYLIRHTSVVVGPSVCYGQADVPLASTFEAEAITILNRLAPVSAWFTSPATRCTRLAHYLASAQGSTAPVEDERLWELSFGSWELRAWSDIPRSESDPWALDFVHKAPPGGETLSQLSDRVKCFVEDVVTSGKGRLGIVTHAGPIRAMLSYVTGSPLDQLFRFHIGYGSVSLVKRVGDLFERRYIHL